MLALLLVACVRSEALDATTSIAPPPTTPTPAPPPSSPGVVSTPAPDPIVIDRAAAPWATTLAGIVDDPRVSVAVGVGHRIVFVHAGARDRIPASGQKLLTSMAALDLLGAEHRFPTIAAAATRAADGVLDDDLWLVGGGDPEVGPERLARLAHALRRAGVRRITGDVIGDTAAFSRRWWAPGWVRGLSHDYVTRPTALTFSGNGDAMPELAAAASLATALEAAAVRVDGAPGTGDAPERLHELARVRSAPLGTLLARQNTDSLNLYAEVLLRALGDRAGDAGTTAAGADTVEAWAATHGVEVRVRDGSGLSHGDAASSVDLVSLLLLASREPWGQVLERILPAAGEGTLDDRLTGIPIRAKTGTLITVPCSTLAGYVREANGRSVAFAILSQDMSKAASTAVEDAVVRTLASTAIG